MRLIDADALIKELNNEDNQRILDGLACCNNGDMEAGFMYGLGAVEKLINDQPTADDWIPCSERLPKAYTVICCDEYENMIIGHIYEDESSSTGYACENDEVIMDSVVAWKESPKPYAVGSKARKNFFNTLPEETEM